MNLSYQLDVRSNRLRFTLTGRFLYGLAWVRYCWFRAVRVRSLIDPRVLSLRTPSPRPEAKRKRARRHPSIKWGCGIGMTAGV